MPKHIYIIAGPNGAGKTTFAKEFLPHFAKCDVFINADLVATGLSPFSPRSAAIQAGRLVLKSIDDFVLKGIDFGFETTLSGKSYLALLQRLRKKHYRIHLYFLWLPDVNLAIKRVKDRVAQGGHSVPEQDIRRRFMRGLKHFLTDYQPLLDEWVIFDNSGSKPREIAFGIREQIYPVDFDAFKRLKERIQE